MGAQGAGGVIGGNTGMTLQNVGGQVAVAGGQVQNGDYVNVLGTGTGAVGTAFGGQVGNNIAFSGNQLQDMVQAGQNQQYVNAVNG